MLGRLKLTQPESAHTSPSSSAISRSRHPEAPMPDRHLLKRPAIQDVRPAMEPASSAARMQSLSQVKGFRERGPPLAHQSRATDLRPVAARCGSLHRGQQGQPSGSSKPCEARCRHAGSLVGIHRLPSISSCRVRPTVSGSAFEPVRPTGTTSQESAQQRPASCQRPGGCDESITGKDRRLLWTLSNLEGRGGAMWESVSKRWMLSHCERRPILAAPAQNEKGLHKQTL